VDVPATVRMKNVTMKTEGIYQFAVAANTRQYSSGMVWATCTILHNKVVGKLKTVSIEVTQRDALKVHWRLDCSDRVGIITGYRVTYCKLDSPDETAICDGPELHKDTPPDQESVWVDHLAPWTYYKVSQYS